MIGARAVSVHQKELNKEPRRGLSTLDPGAKLAPPSQRPTSMNSAVLLDPARLDRPDTDIRLAAVPVSDRSRPAAGRGAQRPGARFPALHECRLLPLRRQRLRPFGQCPGAAAWARAAFASAVGQRLGIPNLGQFPTLVTLCRSAQQAPRHHPHGQQVQGGDGLALSQPQWPDTSDGCLRFLGSIDDIDSVLAPELKPLYGEFAVFKRCDNSFHGHLPYEGERRVIQVAWLTSEEEKLRKTKRGKFARGFKKIFGSSGPQTRRRSRPQRFASRLKQARSAASSQLHAATWPSQIRACC